MSGFICLLSAIKESPSGENTLAGRNDRTDLHLSLQLTLTTPAAYRNDRWCRAVWGSQQVHSAFCSFFFFFSPLPHFLLPFPFFLWDDTKLREIPPTDMLLPATPCSRETNIPANPAEPLLGTSLVAPDAQALRPPPCSLPLHLQRQPGDAVSSPASSSSQLSPPSQEGRGEITPPYVLSPPSHPTSMTEAVQMPLESGWTRLPSSSVKRTKAAFPISQPKGLLPPPCAC